jgi:hypothetical protein
MPRVRFRLSAVAATSFCTDEEAAGGAGCSLARLWFWRRGSRAADSPDERMMMDVSPGRIAGPGTWERQQHSLLTAGCGWCRHTNTHTGRHADTQARLRTAWLVGCQCVGCVEADNDNELVFDWVIGWCCVPLLCELAVCWVEHISLAWLDGWLAVGNMPRPKCVIHAGMSPQRSNCEMFSLPEKVLRYTSNLSQSERM